MILLLWLAAMPCRIHAQTATNNSNDEIWPEMDVLYRINQKFRAMIQISGTRRESQYADGSFAAYFDYFTLPLVRKPHYKTDTIRGYFQWFRLGYTYGKSAQSESEDDAFREHTINLESNTRFHLPFQFLVTAKNRFDASLFNGAPRARYRPRLTLERDCKTTYLTFTMYAYGEYFFDFNTSTQNKFRLCLGGELWVSRIISFETYYLKQFQGGADGANTDALGVVLKFNFARKQKIPPPEEDPGIRIRSK